MAVNHRSTASLPAQEPPLMIARVPLYARVSTLNGQDPEMQLSELREYASLCGWNITSEYVDQGVSGSKESRSGQRDKQIRNDAVGLFTMLPPGEYLLASYLC